MNRRILFPAVGVFILVCIFLVVVIDIDSGQLSGTDNFSAVSSESASENETDKSAEKDSNDDDMGNEAISQSDIAVTNTDDSVEETQSTTESVTQTESSTGVETTEEYFIDDSSEIQLDNSGRVEMAGLDVIENDEIVEYTTESTYENTAASTANVAGFEDSSQSTETGSDSSAGSRTNPLELPLVPIG